MSTPPADRMAYLLKHALLTLTEINGPALEPFGVDGRSLAVLTVLAGATPLSQQQAAARLSVDRTTMVALIDGLEAKGLVVRTPDPVDRRKNVIALTDAGRDTCERAGAASRAAERQFLAPLTATEAAALKTYLQKLL